MGLEGTVPQTSLRSMAFQHPKCVMAGKETGSEQCITPKVHCMRRGAQISTQTHTGIAARYVCADIETQTIQALSAVHSWGCLLSVPFNEALYINEGPEECCAQSVAQSKLPRSLPFLTLALEASAALSWTVPMPAAAPLPKARLSHEQPGVGSQRKSVWCRKRTGFQPQRSLS